MRFLDAVRPKTPSPWHALEGDLAGLIRSGIVPENDSTGGKVKQKGLSKKGDRYLRSLLVTGAMAVVRQAQIRPDKHPWVTKLLGRMSAKQAAIAIANKTARIAW